MCQFVFILIFIGLLAYFMYGASEHRLLSAPQQVTTPTMTMMMMMIVMDIEQQENTTQYSKA